MISLKISGCGNCPFCNHNPEDGPYYCNFPNSIVEDENVDCNSETYPKNCPLINQEVVINQGSIPPYDKAWHQRNFSLGDFIYETIGLGRSLAIGETQLDAIKAIEKDIVDLHLEKNKEMYEQRGTSVKITSPVEEEFPDDYPRSGVKGLRLKNRTTVTKMEAVKFPPTEAIINQYNNAVKNNCTAIINSLELVYDIPETIKQKA